MRRGYNRLMDKRWLLAFMVVGIIAGVGIYLYLTMGRTLGRTTRVSEWLRNPSAHPDWAISAGTRCSQAAPFVTPTNGLAGYLWGDSFQAGKRHQGIDIFGGTGPGRTPVVAAYPGYLTRLPAWKSAVIVRVPSDPLETGRQIWLYYTHMADQNGSSFISSDFPAGTSETYVEAGTLLGYQGNYTGDANSPTGVHLHFSIVLDNGKGGFLNELDINNTLDPSPYLGLPLNAQTSDGNVIRCTGSG
jgi:murein DD-endopeptidase MepM/ murein hydrolase activator NlpD